MQKQAVWKRLAGMAMAALVSLPLSAQKSQSISIFKNGSAFIRLSDTVRSVNNRSTIPVPSDARFGTLWLSSNSASIASMTSSEGELAEKESFENIREMLKYNIGKRVRLVLAYQDPLEATVSSLVNNYAIFRTKDRWITTDITKIETIEFLDEPNMMHPKTGRLLEINWENSRPMQDYNLMYMCKGIGWVPEYLIQINETNTATLKLQANMVNDGVDMNHAEVNFVVGVPNFQQGDIVDPLASQQSVADLLNALNGTDAVPAASLLSNSFSMALNPDKKTMPDGNGTESSQEGSTTEDYFFYTLKDVSLNQGQRTSLPLLEAEVPVRHIYSAELPPNTNRIPRYSAEAGAKIQPNEVQVYHSVELTNQTSKPWTTGSALMVSTEKGTVRPVAQDILPYAPKGGKTEFRITVAPDIKVSTQEQETGRDVDNKRKNGELYDVVTVEGKITIKNYKDKAVVLDIKRTIAGDLQKSDTNWTVTKSISLSDPNNPRNNVSWEVSLQPNDEQTITYKYTMQVGK